MAAINDLIDRISDPELRRRIGDEVARMQQQKKFGLVFEEHLPEATPLYDVPIKRKSLVAEKDGFFKVFYRVKRIDGEKLVCETQDDKHEEVCFEKEKMVTVAMFGDPIYPYLKPIDEVQNAPGDKLWHTLIEAENYHALQLLIYLYGGKVDCIYIDPPYNTGDKSWKYNNDYVDSNDSYRHSKWLSMMKKRLLLAKKLLNPKDSVLIVTIDEKEYLRLGCLLEEIFPDTIIQMVSIVHNPGGAIRVDALNKVNEYAFYIFIGEAKPSKSRRVFLPNTSDTDKDIEKKSPIWRGLLRGGSGPLRRDSPQKFYPILVDKQGVVVGAGEFLPLDKSRDSYVVPEGLMACWPIKSKGVEGRWELKRDTFISRLKMGFVRAGSPRPDGTRTIYYLRNAEIERIDNGEIVSNGINELGYHELDYANNLGRSTTPKTIWNSPRHNATEYGANLIKEVLSGNRFPYPKSLYAVEDSLSFIVANKPNALIVDFFAGSGTTLHAVNLLNAEDGGHRQCIMVTNNEVSAKEEDRLKAAGYHPGQEEWDKWGIARYVNWPRTKCSILGVDVNGEPLKGNYQTYLKQEKERERTIKQITLIDDPSSLKMAQKKELVALCCQGKLPQSLVKADSKFIVSEEHPCSILFDINYAGEWLDKLDGQDHVTELFVITKNTQAFRQLKEDIQNILGNVVIEESVMRPMSEGFAANAKYFKLGFLDKDSVELQRQFRELLPLLWMKAGAIGRCPELEGSNIPEILLLEDNSMAILTDEEVYVDFRKMMEGRKDIKSIFIVTNSEDAFMSMAKPFSWAQCYQLYKDYLENFSINYERR